MGKKNHGQWVRLMNEGVGILTFDEVGVVGQ